MSVMRARLNRWIGMWLACLWFAGSTFAHAHMTHLMASAAVIDHHPAMEVPNDRDGRLNEAFVEKIVVIDAAIFWHVVDDYQGHADHSGTCALSAPALPLDVRACAVAATPQAFDATEPVSFVTRTLAPDTPPPRI